MTLVIDASIAASWFLRDEESALADRVLDHLLDSNARAPSLFWFEMRNILLMAERRGRMSNASVRVALEQLRHLPIDDDGNGSDGLILDLAAHHRLTAYDASYLALAQSAALPLATADRALAAAADAAGVPRFR